MKINWTNKRFKSVDDLLKQLDTLAVDYLERNIIIDTVVVDKHPIIDSDMAIKDAKYMTAAGTINIEYCDIEEIL